MCLLIPKTNIHLCRDLDRQLSNQTEISKKQIYSLCTFAPAAGADNRTRITKTCFNSTTAMVQSKKQCDHNYYKTKMHRVYGRMNYRIWVCTSVNVENITVTLTSDNVQNHASPLSLINYK